MGERRDSWDWGRGVGLGHVIDFGLYSYGEPARRCILNRGCHGQFFIL